MGGISSFQGNPPSPTFRCLRMEAVEEARVSICCIVPRHERRREVAGVSEGKRRVREEGPP